jgi:Fe-S cluster assembly iron-binding protein IscA
VVQLTDSAMDQLEAIRDGNNLPEEAGIAIVPTEQGELSLAAISPQPNDEVHTRNDKTVLIVPEMLIEPLSDVTIDFVSEGDEQGFVFTS